jgi:CBS domain containing-hemolysin-like protein
MIEGFNLLLVVFLVLANGFFVASEFALVGVRRSRVESLAAGGDKNAVRLLGLINNLNAYISATQLGITLSSLALGWIGEPAVAHLLEVPLQGLVSETVLHTISFTIAFSIITFLHIVVGELAPKTIALERAEKTAFAIALPMQIFYRTFYYPIRLLDWAGTRTVRLLGLHPTTEHASIYTEDELRNLIEISQKSGHLKVEEQQLIDRAFDFSGADVREAMIPRISVDAISVDATFEEAKAAFRSFGYSRLPVYRERLDNIVGLLFRRDLEPYLEGQKGFRIEDLLHAPLYVPETAKLGPVLRQMQSSRTHLAIVVDEHGGMEGLVTLEDLLEEIVGEIDDEFDEEARSQIVKQADGTYLIDGMLAIRDANKQLSLNLPEDQGYTTIAGFLMAWSGMVLEAEDVVEYEGLRFRVQRTDKRRIKRIHLTVRESGGNDYQTVALLASLSTLVCQQSAVFVL